MKTTERYEALLKIQVQLQEWASYQPPWHFKLHGSKEINIALQDIKKLIQHEALNLLAEESQEVGLYDDNPCASISLHNIE